MVKLLLVLAFGAVSAPAAEVRVADAAAFRNAVRQAGPGTRILLAPGEYGGGFHFENTRGEAGRPIVIAAANPQQPPTFTGGQVAMHFSNPAHLEIHEVIIAKASGNGLNIDHGGNAMMDAAQHILVRGVRVRDVGDRGNQDGIKLSGLADFRIENCTVDGWGDGGGSGIDMVGCHRGLIQGCTFKNADAPASNGVQCKGGSSAITIRRNVFDDTGGRGVNIGGSTGLQFFRPPLKPGGAHAEARDIRVEGNRFTGSMAPISFVGVDGAVVRFNTIERPSRWAIRILQENKAPGFVPCRNGEFSDNLVVFEAARWSEGGVNIGGGTAPQTFKFTRNWWYCADRPDRSQPKLPVEETGGIYGREPAAAKTIAGADAFKEAK